MIYSFLITLKDQRSGRTERVNFDSVADNYLDAWKEAAADAWAALNEHDYYWFVESIKHCM